MLPYGLRRLWARIKLRSRYGLIDDAPPSANPTLKGVVAGVPCCASIDGGEIYGYRGRKRFQSRRSELCRCIVEEIYHKIYGTEEIKRADDVVRIRDGGAESTARRRLADRGGLVSLMATGAHNKLLYFLP